MSWKALWLALSGVCILLILLYMHIAAEVATLRDGVLPLNVLYSQHDKISQGSAVLDPEKIVIIYNRVPKTASTSFIGLAYDLCYKNNFNVLHINTTKNSPTLSLTDQVLFVRNISNWEVKKPGIYHGHIAYLDFNRFGVMQQPLFINIIRKPLDRLVSYYYFIRYGDDLRPHLVRKRMGDKMTLDECVAIQHPDCNPNQMWIQVPYFCGHAAECWVPGSVWAFEQAKHNLVHNYFLVGLTEELGDFVAMLEYSLPRLFAGAINLYQKG
ncbi:unnamed protein product, partial [Meganyctiphanes norvegica]